MALTEKQKRFADYYLETGNATEAYQKAGYKKYKSVGIEASKTLKNPNVSAYIEERRKQMDEKRIATVDDVLLFFTQVMNGEVKDQFGLEPQLSDRISAGKELMRRFEKIKTQLDIAEQEARIAATRARAGLVDEEEEQDDGFLDALKGSAEEDWADEDEE